MENENNLIFLSLEPDNCCNNYFKNKVYNFKYDDDNYIIPYGNDNMLPQFLIDLYRNSPTNSSIIDRKVDYTCGVEIISSSNFDDIKFNDGDELYQLFKQITLDYYLYGGFCLQIIWKKFENKIGKIIYQPFQNTRIGYKDGIKGVYIGDNFSNSNYLLNNSSDLQFYNFFNPKIKMEEPSFFYYKKYSPGMTTYPLPFYHSAIKSISSEVEIINLQFNNIINAFMPSGILKLPNTVKTIDMNDLKRTIKEELSGTENAGKILTVFSDGENSLEWIPFSNGPDDKKLTESLEIIRENILIAHKIPSKTLIGLPGGPSLSGDGNTLDISSKEFFNKIIKPAQSDILKELEYILDVNYDGIDLEVNQSIPGEDEIQKNIEE